MAPAPPTPSPTPSPPPTFEAFIDALEVSTDVESTPPTSHESSPAGSFVHDSLYPAMHRMSLERDVPPVPPPTRTSSPPATASRRAGGLGARLPPLPPLPTYPPPPLPVETPSGVEFTAIQLEEDGEWLLGTYPASVGALDGFVMDINLDEEDAGIVEAAAEALALARIHHELFRLGDERTCADVEMTDSPQVQRDRAWMLASQDVDNPANIKAEIDSNGRAWWSAGEWM
ncbi:hypothetical protein MKEN_00559100 [Mycena kentingensis (nom. inval.)]|nr:hypothetical protein MKEN_00559100 [Mycena kentingensis (nom. inval.)]